MHLHANLVLKTILSETASNWILEVKLTPLILVLTLENTFFYSVQTRNLAVTVQHTLSVSYQTRPEKI